MEGQNVRESALELFPNEIWAKIASMACNNERLNLRLVSKEMKIVADQVLKEKASLWKSTFDIDFQSFALSVRGKRFVRTAEIITFLSETEGVDWNPFPNGTVICIPELYHLWGTAAANRNLRHCQGYSPWLKEGGDYFYEKFLILLDRFKEEITTLVYCFKDTDDKLEISRQLQAIFKLKNLRHLVVQRPESKVTEYLEEGLLAYQAEEANKTIEMSKLNALRELIIFGRRRTYDLIIGVPCFIRALCASVCDSCQRLQFCSIDSASLSGNQTGHPISFQKLKKLKVTGTLLHDQELGIFTNEVVHSRLEEVSFNMLYYELRNDELNFYNAVPSVFPRILSKLNHQMQNLNLFHLDFPHKITENEPITLYAQVDKLEFPNMTRLVLKYATIMKWSHLVDYARGKFPNLRELTIIVEKNGASKEIWDFVRNLWAKLPESMEIIKVPRYLWNIRRDGSVTLS